MSKKPDPFMVDDENPLWTAEDFREARPIADADPELLTAMLDLSEKRLRGQRGPQRAPIKSRLTVRFDPDVVAWFQGQGPGYQSRMNDALREYIEAH